MEIKTVNEFYDDNLSPLNNMINYAKYILDYASENVEADYEVISNNEMFKADVNGCLEVYIPKGEFDKIKELIK